MKAGSFRKRVDDLRKTLESNADKWGGADRDSTKNVVHRVSAFSSFDLNSRSPNKLLDSAASVHVSNTKEKFSNFKRVLKGQGLLYGSNLISIEGWGQISLSLKVKSKIKLLTLNNVAYILNFPSNLVSLGCLQKHGFDWSYRSGSMSKNNLIIGYPVSNQVSVAISLSVGCEYHDAVHVFYKRRFSQAWPCPVTSHFVSLLLGKSIKPTIDLTLQIPHD